MNENLLIGFGLLLFFGTIFLMKFLISRLFDKLHEKQTDIRIRRFRNVQVSMKLKLYDPNFFATEGKTNRQLMAEGLSPYAFNGQRVILMRSTPLTFMQASEHTKSSINKEVKARDEKASQLKRLNDEKFAAWSANYWKWRARKMK